MSLMLSSMYDAPIDGGTSDEKARKAAEEVANYDNRLNTLDAKMTLLQWMAGVNIALTVGVLLKLMS
ncbi:MAG: hypothetical protein ACKVOP_02465 [Sphingomonadaceae bacterium]